MLSVTRNLEPALDPDGRLIVQGYDLRYALTVLLLAAGDVLSVSELGDGLGGSGLAVNGRAGKSISDALRSEVRMGRVVRVGRGRYRAHEVPRVTRWRIRRHVAQLDEIRRATAVQRPSIDAPDRGADVVCASSDPADVSPCCDSTGRCRSGVRVSASVVATR